MTIKDIRNLPKDLDRQISRDFNSLINLEKDILKYNKVNERGEAV